MSRSRSKTLALTFLAMTAFAGNSLLCRLALRFTAIDPASFTALRIVSGALALWVLIRLRSNGKPASGNWPSALALFAYAAAFSWAYVGLPAATGALLLFGSVQATMICAGLVRGERLNGSRLLGFAIAVLGLVALLLPGISAPPVVGSMLMLFAGAAWAVYSLRGAGAIDATAVTAGNFARAAVLATGVGLVMLPWATVDRAGALYAIVSGALTSGLGYVVWYVALRGLSTIEAATVQLCVPVVAAVGGILFIGEPVTPRIVLCGAAILGGVALVVLHKRAD
ncbi:MAG: EamA-like transporter family protein [Herminiimonas sp.]|nr:EamA-like transporter family protein [Herminiimonas sp.]